MAIITLKSGREIYCSQGVLGIEWFTPKEEQLYDGFDGSQRTHYQTWMTNSDYEDDLLTDDEKREIAEQMIERWKEWGGLYE